MLSRILLLFCVAFVLQVAESSHGGGEHVHHSCMYPLDPGNCSGFAVRYFYNAATHNCEVFRYTGCGGNRNRFQTLRHCMRLCVLNSTRVRREALKPTSALARRFRDLIQKVNS